MISNDEALPHNYHTTTTSYYHIFLSYITGSIYNVVIVVVNFPHVGNNSHDIFFTYIPLMIVDYYHIFAFHLREYRKKLCGSCVVVIFHDFYFPYGIGQKTVVVKCGSNFSRRGSFPKIGGAFN
jgi:hypothetical protein